ncbi:hypothetical protein D3C71_2091770 [compost metagenome]
MEAVGEVHRRPPLPMAGGQIDAGHRRVVAADPAAQGALPDQGEQRQRRQHTQVTQHASQRRQRTGQAQGEQEQQTEGGEAAEQMGGNHLRP